MLELEWAAAKVEYSSIDKSRIRQAPRGLVGDAAVAPKLTPKDLAQVARLKVPGKLAIRDQPANLAKYTVHETWDRSAVDAYGSVTPCCTLLA